MTFPFQRRSRVAPFISILALFLVTAPAEAQPAAEDLPALASARADLAAGRVADALTALRDLATRNPDSAAVALWRGHAERLSGNREAAARAYLQAARLEPLSAAEAWLGIAQLQSEVGDRSAAAGTIARAMELAPDLPESHRLAAANEMHLRRYGRAAEHLKQYLLLRPDDYPAHNALGVALYLAQQTDAAAGVLEALLQTAPDDTEAHFNLGVALAERPAENDRALRHLRQALSGDPSNPNAHYLIGRILIDCGNLEDGIASLRRSVELSPDQLDAHYRLTQALARQGDTEGAAHHRDRFNELQRRTDAADHVDKLRGTLDNELAGALANDDLQGATRVLEQLLELAPNDPDVLVRVAMTYLSAGQVGAAVQAAERAVQADPDHWEALYVAGLSLQRAKRLEDADGYLARAIRANPGFADVRAVAGNVLMALNRPSAAAEAYRTATELQPDKATHYLNLATAYSRLGLGSAESKAMAIYRRLLQSRRDPEPS